MSNKTEIADRVSCLVGALYVAFFKDKDYDRVSLILDSLTPRWLALVTASVIGMTLIGDTPSELEFCEFFEYLSARVTSMSNKT